MYACHMRQTDTEKTDRYDSARKAFMEERAKKIRLAVERAAHAERYVVNTVRNAHDAGMSWTEIGELLGVSRRAARQKYAEKITD